MESEESVSHWAAHLRAGDADAAQRLWERYFAQLVQLARQKLPARRGFPNDEEDVALSAFQSFCRGVREGRFPQLADSGDLWRLLVVITAHKAMHIVRDAQRLKRGGPISARSPRDEDEAVSQIVGKEPTPEFAAQVAEELEHLLQSLGDATLQAVAVWKMEGFTNDEIGAKLGCAPRTVERKLRLIRQILESGATR
jgi:DNA-directed RNA polymerase specialized sigma24 family protein